MENKLNARVLGKRLKAEELNVKCRFFAGIDVLDCVMVEGRPTDILQAAAIISTMDDLEIYHQYDYSLTVKYK